MATDAHPNPACAVFPREMMHKKPSELTSRAVEANAYSKGARRYCEAEVGIEIMKCVQSVMEICPDIGRSLMNCPAHEYLPRLCPLPTPAPVPRGPKIRT